MGREAVYGSRGSNGVILIKTRGGSKWGVNGSLRLTATTLPFVASIPCGSCLPAIWVTTRLRPARGPCPDFVQIDP